MMPSCVQADKRGCERFAEQLEHIVVSKVITGPVGHLRGTQGEPPKGEPSNAAVGEQSKAVPTVKKAHFHKPGARIKQDELSTGDSFVALSSSAPSRYGEWCANLYQVATSTYVPKAAPAKDATAPAKGAETETVAPAAPAKKA